MRRLAIAAVLAACHRAPPRVVVEVEASWPGTSPDEMATSIATPLERALGQMPHVAAVSSVSREGKTVVRVEVEGDRDTALAEARRAVEPAMRLLPASMPRGPGISTPGEVIGSYLVAADKAEEAAIRLEHEQGVMRVETCGLRGRREAEIIVDPARLAATGLTLADVQLAVAAANVNVPAGHLDGPRQEFSLSTGDSHAELMDSLVVAYRDGVTVRLSDVAQLRDAFEPVACVLAPRGMVELDVYGLHRDPVKPLLLDTLPARPEVHGELDPALTPEAALARFAEAVGSDATLADHRSDDGVVRGAVGEIRGSQLVVRGASPVVVDRLRRIVGLVTLGERTATVHVSGADPHAVADAARAIADRLRAGDQLVATHGLVTAVSPHIEVDRVAASRVDVDMAQIDDILATSRGRVVSTIVTQGEEIAVVMRAVDPTRLMLYGTDHALVPLSSIARITQTAAPLEVLHRGQFPDIDLEVQGDPRGAIGSVPAGVRVEVEAASHRD